MRSKVRLLAFIALLVAGVSGSAFAAKKHVSKHMATGTIASIDANQVVVNEKVKGKETPMSFRLDSTTQKTGKLANGTPVTIEYRTDNKQNIATAVRERTVTPAVKQSSKKKS